MPWLTNCAPGFSARAQTRMYSSIWFEPTCSTMPMLATASNGSSRTSR